MRRAAVSCTMPAWEARANEAGPPAMAKRLGEEMHGRIRRLGCSREFGNVEDPELGPRAPKGEGGSNGLDNRALPCGPCSRRRSATLAGLRKRNRKDGLVAKS